MTYNHRFQAIPPVLGSHKVDRYIITGSHGTRIEPTKPSFCDNIDSAIDEARRLLSPTYPLVTVEACCDSSKDWGILYFEYCKPDRDHWCLWIDGHFRGRSPLYAVATTVEEGEDATCLFSDNPVDALLTGHPTKPA